MKHKNALSTSLALCAGLATAAEARPLTQTTTAVSDVLAGSSGIRIHMNGPDLIAGYAPVSVHQEVAGAFGPATYLPNPLWPAPDFGLDVAIDGDTLVVTTPGDGDNGDPATAFVYTRVGNDWFYDDLLGAYSDLEGYGRAVVVDGDRIVVGAPLLSRIYTYLRSGGAWVESPSQPWILPSNAIVGGQFGGSLDISGDWLLAGQHGNPVSGANLYSWDGMEWVFETELGPGGVGTDVGAPTGVGVDVAIDGNLAIVTAFGEEVSGLQFAGAAYVFEYDGTQWIGPTRLVPTDPDAFGLFGSSCDIDAASGRAVIGAYSWDTPSGQVNVGAAYVYHRTGVLTWELAERLQPDTETPTLEFGRDVQINQDHVLIGSRGAGVYVHQPVVNLGYSVGAPAVCNGDGGDQSGCVDCPCANSAAPGTRGGCLNSMGLSAELHPERSLSVLQDDLLIFLENGIPSTFALLGSGSAVPSMSPCPLNSGLSPFAGTDGLRCMSGLLVRHGVRRTDANGELLEPWSNLASTAGFQSGQTRHFQAIYRDESSSPCGTGQNTTNAVSISFQP